MPDFRALTWDYPTEGKHAELVAEEILKEMNGYASPIANSSQGSPLLRPTVPLFVGCWIYSGVFPKAGQNERASKILTVGAGHGRRMSHILYNGIFGPTQTAIPWSERKKLGGVWGRQRGTRCSRFRRYQSARLSAGPDCQGDDALAGDKPFILHADGLGWIWVPFQLNDIPGRARAAGPIRNPLYPKQQSNPVAKSRPNVPVNACAAPPNRFGTVLTTYRLTEHHTAGGISRTLSHLVRAATRTLLRTFSGACAAAFRIEAGEWVTVATPRGAVEAHARYTPHANAHQWAKN